MSNYLFYDVETTGLIDFKKDIHHAEQPRIVQLGYIFSKDRQIMAQGSALFKPHGWHEMPEKSQDVHGFSFEDCKEYGAAGDIILQDFFALKRRSDINVAHNMGFDSKLITREKKAQDMEVDEGSPEEFCTMIEMTPILQLPKVQHWHAGDYKWAKLIEAHQHCFGRGFNGEHDAFADVKAMFRVFWWLQDKRDQAVA